MSFRSKTQRLQHVAHNVLRYPKDTAELHLRERAHALASTFPAAGADGPRAGELSTPLETYFDRITEGPGIWKWRHYFDIYHRHFQRFINRPVVVVEVGVYSGGSLGMWQTYFGPQCEIHGVDIEPACRVYARPQVTIHIGDQADRAFWRDFRQAVPHVDILVDDGGHVPEQQMVTLEEMLPHLAAGGVYLCEDIHGIHNQFAQWVYVLADRLNATDHISHDRTAPQHRPSSFQAQIDSVHLYPYVAVIEKRCRPLDVLSAPRHGTQWQPFL
jgi:hypothetical protein